MSASGLHKPVMVAEVLSNLSPKSGSIIVDATVGSGGHALSILPRMLPNGRLIAVDRDREALEAARFRLIEFESSAIFVHGNFRDLPDILHPLGIVGVDGLLLDLGISSMQVDCARRGFGIFKEGPLDMRMDPEQETSAQSLVNSLSLDELTLILEKFGEERFAGRIAKCIVQERKRHSITSTINLADIVVRAVPHKARHGRLHPATRTFQALRIAVNDELGALERFLENLPKLLNPGARAVVITFHSLEDRLVKRAFAEGMRKGIWSLLTKKPLRPNRAEVLDNPRSRSAKLRAVERCA